MGKKSRERALADNEAKAVARMLRVSPQKLNLLAQLIRGKKVASALAELEFSRKRMARDVRKCLESAIANAENNHDLDVDELVDIEIVVVLGIGDCRFQALAHVACHALAGKFKLRERACYFLAANELREKIELLRTNPQHARNSFRFVIGKRTFTRLLAHARSPALSSAFARRRGGRGRAGRSRT